MQDSTNTLRPTALQVDLARRIADDILAHNYRIGAHLSEEVLANQYQVSRTPVRAALKLLASQSLIQSRPNSGYFVCPLPEDAAPPSWHTPGLSTDDFYQMLIEQRAERVLSDSFTDRDLLQRYNVTRSVLAKTLVRLSAESLIEKRKGHGWQFTHSLLNDQARQESYRFRMAVECAALLEPTFQLNDTALQRMRAAHETLVALDSDHIPPLSFFTLNDDFHETLARFSGNRFFLQAVQQQNQLRKLEKPVAFYKMGPRFAASLQEHLQIIEALEQDEREWAAAIMRRHLFQVQKAT
jgi:DNA-binding GntR family transcriptional regulator